MLVTHPGALLLTLLKAGAGIAGPQKPEQYDMEKKPDAPAPMPRDESQLAAWAAYAGALEVLVETLLEDMRSLPGFDPDRPLMLGLDARRILARRPGAR